MPEEFARTDVFYDPLQSRSLQLESASILPDFVVCPSFRKPRWALEVLPEIGIVLPLKNLSNNSAESNDIFDMRLADENSLEGLSAGLYARVRPVKKHIYLKLGVSYTRISERMNLSTSWIEQDTSVGIISITQSQSGDTITTIYGDIITETEHFRTSSDHYFLHMLDVPLAIGYARPMGAGWRLGFEGGVHFNLAFQSKGKLLEGSGEDSFTQLPAEGRFRPRLSLSYYWGLTLEKQLTARSAVYISPRLRYFAGSFTPESYEIRQTYALGGLYAGYIYTIR